VNRAEIVASMNRVSSELLREKGFISFVDVLIRMDRLTKEDYESWCMRRVTKAAKRIVELYEAWGKPDRAADGQKKLGLTSPDFPSDVVAR
jgi:hypothetical protein